MEVEGKGRQEEQREDEIGLVMSDTTDRKRLFNLRMLRFASGDSLVGRQLFANLKRWCSYHQASSMPLLAQQQQHQQARSATGFDTVVSSSELCETEKREPI